MISSGSRCAPPSAHEIKERPGKSLASHGTYPPAFLPKSAPVDYIRVFCVTGTDGDGVGDRIQQRLHILDILKLFQAGRVKPQLAVFNCHGWPFQRREIFRAHHTVISHIQPLPSLLHFRLLRFNALTYKVVEGRSKRQFTDLKAVVDVAAGAGFTDVYRQELIPLTEFEKMMGKKRFQEILGAYVVKPPGKLALVPNTGPRPAVDLSSTVEDEFSALE